MTAGASNGRRSLRLDPVGLDPDVVATRESVTGVLPRHPVTDTWGVMGVTRWYDRVTPPRADITVTRTVAHPPPHGRIVDWTLAHERGHIEAGRELAMEDGWAPLWAAMRRGERSFRWVAEVDAWRLGYDTSGLAPADRAVMRFARDCMQTYRVSLRVDDSTWSADMLWLLTYISGGAATVAREVLDEPPLESDGTPPPCGGEDAGMAPEGENPAPYEPGEGDGEGDGEGEGEGEGEGDARERGEGGGQGNDPGADDPDRDYDVEGGGDGRQDTRFDGTSTEDWIRAIDTIMAEGIDAARAKYGLGGDVPAIVKAAVKQRGGPSL